MEYLAIANGLVGLLETVMRKVSEARRNGQVSVEDQAKLQARMDALRKETFSGPEWKPSINAGSK